MAIEVDGWDVALGVGLLVVLYLLWTPMVFHPPCKVLRENDDAKNMHKEKWDAIDLERVLEEKCPKTGKSYLVVGAGFLGCRMVHMLLLRGETRIKVLDIAKSPLPEQIAKRIEYIRGDVTNLGDLESALDGVDVVMFNAVYMCFHERGESLAPLAEAVNIGGIENMIKACKAKNISKLVYTSTSHVCLGDVPTVSLKMNEDSPLVTREESHNNYSWTKAIAENHCIANNLSLCQDGKTKLEIGIIRPCSAVFGRGDRLMIDNIVERGLALCWTPLLCDFVYVENLAFAHLLLEKTMLGPGNHSTTGIPYCVSNAEPLTDYEFRIAAVTALSRDHGDVRLIHFQGVPLLLWMISQLFELVRVFIPSFKLNSDLDFLTPAVMEICKRNYVFDCSRAAKELGYTPIYTVRQALQKTSMEFAKRAVLPALE